jgi:hypothetical protein
VKPLWILGGYTSVTLGFLLGRVKKVLLFYDRASRKLVKIAYGCDGAKLEEKIMDGVGALRVETAVVIPEGTDYKMSVMVFDGNVQLERSGGLVVVRAADNDNC